ncbi:MAG: DUF5808 domain-containing protein [Kibdelosporangium sp.]
MILLVVAVITGVTCFALATAALGRPTLPFGVRVAAVRADDPAIVAQRRIYTRLVLSAAVLAAVLAVALELGALAVAVALGVADMAFYYLAYRRIRAVKRQEWWQAEHRYGVTVDTSFRTNPVRIPWLWLTPAVAVLVVTVTIGWGHRLDTVLVGTGLVGTVLGQLGATVLMPVVALLVLRARPDLDAARPVASARRYRVYLLGTARLVLLLATAINLQLLLRALPQWGLVPRTTFWTAAQFVPLGLVVLGFLYWEFRVGQAGHRLPALPGEADENTGVVQRDDDKYWFLAGMIYVNRRDPAVLVHRRVGVYWTLNLGHPVAWLVLAAVLVTALLTGLGVIDPPQRQNWF